MIEAMFKDRPTSSSVMVSVLRSPVKYKLHGPSVVRKTAEWLARYSDTFLKTCKHMTETEMDGNCIKDPQPHQ